MVTTVATERKGLTVRFPPDLLVEARATIFEDESLNDLIVRALEREVRRRKALDNLAEIDLLREAIRQRGGTQPDSAPLIRALRSGEGRRV